jgi:hypothetical protein
MKTRKVVSREYKLMLQAARFAGTDDQLLVTAGQLWDDFAGALEPFAASVEGTLDTIAKQRLVAFLDSQARHLWAAGYIFRVRRTLEGGRPEVTLKFRHPDRFVAENRQMKSRRIRAEIKFEEDVKPPFTSLYGFSNTGRIGRKDVPITLDDVSALFPDLAKRLGKVDGSLKLRAVNGFTAREVVVTGPIVTLGAKPRVEAECALIVWYDHHRNTTNHPAAVEFSYRYGNPGGRYSGKVARRAFNIFEMLQRDLTDWIDPNSATKTTLVFG